LYDNLTNYSNIRGLKTHCIQRPKNETIKEGGRKERRRGVVQLHVIDVIELFPKKTLLANMSSKIPPLLEPYLALPPEASLILLTSVLGASSNWLVLRFLHSALLSQDAEANLSPESDTKVVLVSFMRDLAFWKENGKRLVG
jgi:hypothetical protein